MRPLSPLVVVGAAPVLILVAGPASAHSGGSTEARWALDPAILVPLLVAAIAFGAGWLRLRARSAHNGRGLDRRALLFTAGWLALAGALVSPLHEAGGRSFAAHMLEHEVLMLAAAPLLVLSQPLAVMLWAFPLPARHRIGGLARATPVRELWRSLTHPVTATLLQASALWLWHMPSLFDVAVASPAVHAAQHLCFLLSALFFWSAVLHPRAAGAWGLTVLCLFATSIVSGALGAAMAFSESPWYAPYARLPMTRLGLSPAEDQQLAGLLMWIPGGLVHAGAALAVAAAALRPASRLALPASGTTSDVL